MDNVIDRQACVKRGAGEGQCGAGVAYPLAIAPLALRAWTLAPLALLLLLLLTLAALASQLLTKRAPPYRSCLALEIRSLRFDAPLPWRVIT